MNKVLKRFFDIFLSIFLIIIFSPIWLLLIILSLFFKRNFKVFYSDTRIFQNLKEHKTIKFRTMVDNSNDIIDIKKESLAGNYFKNISLNSNLFTPFGKFLERFQLNETLQFFLILVGKMSFVGNRPLPLNIYNNLRQNFQNVEKIYSSPAGLTGPSQIIGKRYLSTKERILIENLYCDMYLLDKKILKVDLIIIFLTLRLIIFNKYANKKYMLKLLKKY